MVILIEVLIVFLLGVHITIGAVLVVGCRVMIGPPTSVWQYVITLFLWPVPIIRGIIQHRRGD